VKVSHIEFLTSLSDILGADIRPGTDSQPVKHDFGQTCTVDLSHRIAPHLVEWDLSYEKKQQKKGKITDF
jgi:hypothetical protein